MDAAVAALLGAALGAVGSVGGVWLTQRHQNRRDLMRAAVDLGRADHDEAIARVSAAGGLMPPMAIFVYYHAEVLAAINKGTFNPAAVARIEAAQAELLRAFPMRR